MTSSKPLSVCAVIVSYFPKLPMLDRLIDAIAKQVDAVVLVDNTGRKQQDEAWNNLLSRITLIPQSRNIGLAAAQNKGISWAKDKGFEFVLLLDQDSLPAEGMVARLVSAYRSQADGTRVAAVGPTFFDPREARHSPFIRVGFPMSRKLWCQAEPTSIECDFLISSGSLIPLSALEDIGHMDESLFIDNVDLEWCFRARHRGYALLGVCGATMRHELGDERVALPFSRRGIVVHGSVRLYYMMRNRIRLYGRNYTPRVWIAQDFPRLMVKLLVFGTLIAPRRRNLRYMFRGILDGILGRGGKCSF